MGTSVRAKVIFRDGPCRCGCQGKDPWHQAFYRRTIRNVRPAQGSARTRDGKVDIVREGVAQLPVGKVRVVEAAAKQFHYDEETGKGWFTPVLKRDGSQATYGWYVDYDSWLEAQNRTLDQDSPPAPPQRPPEPPPALGGQLSLWNPDERQRRLERAARAAGDVESMARAERARVRSGLPPVEVGGEPYQWVQVTGHPDPWNWRGGIDCPTDFPGQPYTAESGVRVGRYRRSSEFILARYAPLSGPRSGEIGHVDVAVVGFTGWPWWRQLPAERLTAVRLSGEPDRWVVPGQLRVPDVFTFPRYAAGMHELRVPMYSEFYTCLASRLGADNVPQGEDPRVFALSNLLQRAAMAKKNCLQWAYGRIYGWSADVLPVNGVHDEWDRQVNTILWRRPDHTSLGAMASPSLGWKDFDTEHAQEAFYADLPLGPPGPPDWVPGDGAWPALEA